ncbi:MAG: hypothetical protein IKV15_07100 [Bacteroidaceae bacterium]|nr:hypothetical protein [Bacteroidaceae bacterium]
MNLFRKSLIELGMPLDEALCGGTILYMDREDILMDDNVSAEYGSLNENEKVVVYADVESGERYCYVCFEELMRGEQEGKCFVIKSVMAETTLFSRDLIVVALVSMVLQLVDIAPCRILIDNKELYSDLGAFDCAEQIVDHVDACFESWVEKMKVGNDDIVCTIQKGY